MELATLIYKLHKIDQSPPLQLPIWQPLISLDHALSDSSAAMVLTSEERDWLTVKIREIRQDFARSDSWLLGQGLVHGDAWAGNLLQTTEGVQLGDWDHLAYGPREVDLIPTWHASRRYGKGRSWVSNFARIYGFDLSEHPMIETLYTMRDLAQISGPLRRTPNSAAHASALRERLTDIREKHTERKWTAL
jgi:aminoglycoside phosphotransferase (APT) family kinase protein